MCPISVQVRLACLAMLISASGETTAFAASTPAASGEVLIFDGKAMPLGAGQASDPALFNSGNRWSMFFTTVGWRQTCAATHHYDYVIQAMGAARPAGQSLATTAPWNIYNDGQGNYSRLLALGGAGEWDADATETP